MLNNGGRYYLELKALTVNALNESNSRQVIVSHILQKYSKHFNSHRILERISTPLDLIKLLEKRDCLSVRNIVPFHQIAEMLENSMLLISKILIYERDILPGNPKGPSYYVAASEPLTNSIAPEQISNGASHISSRQRNLIYEIITLEIGQMWRDLARNLSIRESEIDILDHNHANDLKSKVHKVLNIHETKEPKQWHHQLPVALRKTRRNDLHDKVLKILSE